MARAAPHPNATMIAGFVLFSYDSLVSSKSPAADYLSIVSRGAFAVTSASPQSPTRK